jgi:putative ABC transport system permease protein
MLTPSLRHAFRRLARSPGFAAGAILMLALGIGANTAIFGVVSGVLLRPLPMPEPERLVFITREGDVSIPDGHDWRQQSRSLEEIALFLRTWHLDLVGSGEPVRVNASVVEPEFFRVLRLPALHGRLLTADDNRPGAPGTAVVSEALWRGRFAADPNVLGRVLTLSDVPATVVGVAPAEMDFLRDEIDLWVTPALATPWAFGERGTNNFDAIGRLRPGAGVEASRAEMVAISKRLEAAYPDTNLRKIVEPIGLLDFMVGRARRALLVLLGGVGLVVLVSSVNLATALLARSAARQEEYAVRLALGASRMRVAREVVAEGLLLSLAGGAVGLLAALWTHDGLVAMAADALPRTWAIAVDLRSFGFAAVLAVVVGLVMGLLPAIQVLRGDLGDFLRSGGRGVGGAGRHRLMGVLVGAEVALSVLLLVGAGLLFRTFQRLQSVPLGFDPSRVMLAQVSLPESRYLDRKDAQTRAFRELVGRVGAAPGVESAAYVITPPLEPRGGIGGRLAFREPPPAMPVENPSTRARLVLGDYFRTLRIPIVEGRGFEPTDDERGLPVAIVNARFAREFWPGQSPLGRQIAIPGWAPGPPVWMTIVGVAADVKGATLQEPDFRNVYFPYAQRAAGWQRWGTIVARTSLDPVAFTGTVQGALRAVDPAVPVGRVEALEARRSALLGPERLNAVALGLFAGIALLVALSGIYALLSHAVTERRRELGLRMALGARAADLLRLVVGRGLKLTLAGLATGLLVALALGKAVAGLLFEVAPTDPATYVGVALLLGGAALLSSWLPARRAARLDPMAALRHE